MLRQTLNIQANAALKSLPHLAPARASTSALAAISHSIRLQAQAIREYSAPSAPSASPSSSSSSANPGQQPKYRQFHTTDIAQQAREVPGFPILEDPLVHNHSIPSFMVGTQNGFLPRQDPLDVLPKEYEALEQLLQKMPLTLKDGTPGLLAQGKFGEACKGLPQYDLSNVEDSELLSALYRDYTFVASAYLLEPCDLLYRKTGDYGLGRSVLPKNIAVPLVQVAEKIGAKPFMEYALSYALYNYRRIDKSKGLVWGNLELIRPFSGDPSELGFIISHVTMVSHSGELVKNTMRTLEAADKHNRQLFNDSLSKVVSTYEKINMEMDTMWERSLPADYLKFRTFIMGTKNQPMFPKGVIYEGVSDEPMFHRGESGANDSMVPMGDNLLQLTESMPSNPLTAVLKDFRTYRPHNHAEFLEFVENKARQAQVRHFAEQDPNSAAIYLAAVDQIRNFRNRHWSFTKEYIIKYTKHPVATGGSPIVTWLPNQLATVLKTMQEVGAKIDENRLLPENKDLVNVLTKRADAQARILEREVAHLRTEIKDQDKV
ncbi:hypothetical protein BC939DRAFT_278186 [Gamsiella multidivaricata]|uniref:uncharacterized protein n=1 Tax=Gamsiella multidivaricata TaxID=101098 RepID=UPI00221FF9E8|nr:uncharacterized protein BC939DRAFT_278186 [Gamsiella multidivaricata]KAG0352974.1 hypothetical protein BGZ54_002488 [Gamsiella multidivaricata]KAI7818779.1 hypothetical protein BC939DRAFT_278186 [Gamsiella multidivaricata]